MGDVIQNPQTETSVALTRMFSSDIEQVQQAIATNLAAGEAFTDRDFDRIKIPAGGGTMFQLPVLEGAAGADEIQCVIIGQRLTRAYWATKYTGGGNPPDCSSSDSLTGVGDPGGACAACPLAEFGTAKKPDGSDGKGQACRQMRQLFLLTPYSKLPVVIAAPPTSLRNSKEYLKKLCGAGLEYHGVLTKIKLEATRNDQAAFSKMVMGFGGRLDEKQNATAAQYRQLIQPLIATSPVNLTDYEEVQS